MEWQLSELAVAEERTPTPGQAIVTTANGAP
jgi:hypothetical protein